MNTITLDKPYGGRLQAQDEHGFLAVDGQAQMEYHPVFPGIGLTYEAVHAKGGLFRRSMTPTVFEIRHCREGRMEINTRDGFFCMEPGDLSVCRLDTVCSSAGYPLHHYHGITVTIDVEQAPPCLSCFLEDVDVHPRQLLQALCRDSGVFIARSMPSISHIFEELYHVPQHIRIGYFKVKVLELMLFLSGVDLRTDELAQRSFTNSQKLLAQQVCAYLREHMEQKVTLDQLAEQFHVCGTQIKCSVKGVYGVSLSGMIRTQRMQSAAKLLRDSDLTILEIAGRHGYDNPSKFARAFREVMGVTPKSYRKTPTKIENILS